MGANHMDACVRTYVCGRGCAHLAVCAGACALAHRSVVLDGMVTMRQDERKISPGLAAWYTCCCQSQCEWDSDAEGETAGLGRLAGALRAGPWRVGRDGGLGAGLGLAGGMGGRGCGGGRGSRKLGQGVDDEEGYGEGGLMERGGGLGRG